MYHQVQLLTTNAKISGFNCMDRMCEISNFSQKSVLLVRDVQFLHNYM